MTDAVLLALIYSSLAGIDPALTLAVIKVESNFNQRATGSVGEIGLMQVHPKFVAIPKHKLYNININIREGVRNLANSKLRCKHRESYTFLVCYNAGITGGSKIKNPRAFTYYKRVMKEYKEMSKIFKPGQRVVVLGAYYGGANGAGVIVQLSGSREFKGMYIVDIGEHTLPVEIERLVDEKEFWNEERRKRDNS